MKNGKLNEPIAIVGMSCRYPDARSPAELWDNVLSQRRAFRRMPAERLRLEDYHSPDRNAPDRTYSMEAAVIEGWEFDRVRFKVVGSTYRSADLAHWLALDVASDALADAGYADGKGADKEQTGVVLGNTLTGEFSRAGLLRNRWPYVRRTLEAGLMEEGWPAAKRASFLGALELKYKEPFAPVGDESLAGGLSNTIAGRICNQFDFQGGGYTVDGACCSSLLAVTQACSSLAGGDLDLVLAGGVDLSLDPFEIIGFAKVGALAEEEMRIYDARSAGFWPGEGCGFVVLMRHDDAIAQGKRIYALIRGWGVSSDGSGGLTRPEEEGQMLALKRAYRRAGFGIETLAYFEGHGTGTQVGDLTELRTLSRARREAAAGAPPAVISSMKGNIGHTKAAAGVAGLIKAAMAVHTQVLPPVTGCEQPHEELRREDAALRVLREPMVWPPGAELKAGISAMGFGGINTHVVIEGSAVQRRSRLTRREALLGRTPQDAELFLIGAETPAALQADLERLAAFSGRLSRSELTDLAATLAGGVAKGRHRAAVVASRPSELQEGLEQLLAWLAGGVESRIDVARNLFLGSGEAAPRVGFLFPGQGSPANLDGGIHRRRFDFVGRLYDGSSFDATGDGVATAVAQPAIVTASVAGLRMLKELGIPGDVGVGHSLGELSALHWAGVWDAEGVVRVAAARGRAMSELGQATGAMAGIEADANRVTSLLNGEQAQIAGFNSPRQTVISGPAADVDLVVARAQEAGYRAVRLAVSHAFHSPLVEAAAPMLAEKLRREPFSPLCRRVVSTITGRELEEDEDLGELLCRQVTSPVRFTEAIAKANTIPVDLWIEAGPGRVLGGLMADIGLQPVVSMDAGGSSMRGLLQAVGACFVLGQTVDVSVLFRDRFTRGFPLDWSPRFIANPCELAPLVEGSGTVSILPGAALPVSSGGGEVEPVRVKEAVDGPGSVLELVRRLVAERAELPAAAVRDESRLLTDLHLNSISVGQVVSEAAKRLALPAPLQPGDYATATVGGVARALEERLQTGAGSGTTGKKEAMAPGVASWIRSFVVEQREHPVGAPLPGRGAGRWKVIGAGDPWVPDDLARRLEAAGVGGGVAVCLSGEPIEEQVHWLLEGAREVLDRRGQVMFLLVQPAPLAGGFARTLHLETGAPTCVVEMPAEDAAALDRLVAEVRAADLYVEASYDAGGVRRSPRLCLLPDEEEGPLPLGADDVVLVTGGGKGIAAECALELGRRTGARLALLGRSALGEDAELEANLKRIREAGVGCGYYPADVTDAASVLRAVEAAGRELGVITGFIHGAGINVPQLLGNLGEEAFQRTLSPKLRGARHVLAALDPDRLKVFVTFGSIIGRMGLQGEADYAVANENLTTLTAAFQRGHPDCRCLAVEWSVWSGVGMGQRLGRVDALMEEGITPIPPGEGIRILCALLGRKLPSAGVVVAGRFGEPDTMPMEKPALPLLRFIDQVRVFYPGVELVVDTVLSSQSDPYVEDHVYHGERLFPAVMGLEAMAQAAGVLAGAEVAPVFEEVRLTRPVVVPRSGSVTLRLAALVTGAGEVEIALRTSETDFQIDHFRCRCRFDAAAGPGLAMRKGAEVRSAALAIDIQAELYDGLLFHTGRFVRVKNYRLLRAKESMAQLEADGEVEWFGRYLPQEKVLGDAGVRDAAIHAVQASIPHARLLPVAVRRITIGAIPCLFKGGRRGKTAPELILHSREVRRDGDRFFYDLDLLGEGGSVLERWEGLELRRVETIRREEPWPEALLGPYLERRLEELLPGGGIQVGLGRHEASVKRPERTDALLSELLGGRVIRRRPDGKPEMDGGAVSASHADPLTLVVAGRGLIGCDMEPAGHREAGVWEGLLGEARHRLAQRIAVEGGGGPDESATRVWTAMECLKKAGVAPDAPVLFDAAPGDGWVMLKSGALTMATVVVSVRGRAVPLVLGFLAGGVDAGV